MPDAATHYFTNNLPSRCLRPIRATLFTKDAPARPYSIGKDMKQTITFNKMHGIGNDFVVSDERFTNRHFSHDMIVSLADRHTGIGFDQLLLIEPSEKADYFCRIYNPDGSEAEQCGNGLRCVARFLHEEGIHAAPVMRIETRAGVFPVEIQDYDHITVQLGAPNLQTLAATLAVADQTFQEVAVLSVGNPHAIVLVNSLHKTPVNVWGHALSEHHYFSKGANIGFMQVLDRHAIALSTYERGAGQTLACGSNATAAACAAILKELVESPVKVQFARGVLVVTWHGLGTPLYLSGSAALSFRGVCLI